MTYNLVQKAYAADAMIGFHERENEKKIVMLRDEIKRWAELIETTPEIAMETVGGRITFFAEELKVALAVKRQLEAQRKMLEWMANEQGEE